jgi:mannose-1-phosphate guanylyltransferase
MTQAMILSAGRGERLRPLTDELPKPLLPVGAEPMLAHIAHELSRLGYSDAVANTHWMAEKFSRVVHGLDIGLTLVHEPELRGVAGGIAGARPWLSPPVVVWNGDIFMYAPALDRLVEIAAATGGICLGLAPSRGPGTVGLDVSGRVVRLRGERHGIEVTSADYVGLQGLGEQALAELPDRGCIIADYCLPRLRRGEPVYTSTVISRWYDVGSLPGYLAANQYWLERQAQGGAFVHPSAQVAAAVTITGSVVGEGARVDGSGLLSDCIVWPGSRVSAPQSRSVITPHARVLLDVTRGR